MIIKRILLSLLFICCLLLASAYWFISKKLNPETLRTLANHTLAQFIQQPLNLQGPLRFEMLPRPGIHIRNLLIGTPASPYYSKIDNLFLNLSFTPLLQGKFVFNRLLIDGFTLILHPDAFPNTTPKSSPPKASQDLAIDQIQLKQGQLQIIYPEHTLALSQFELSAQQFNLKKYNFPFHIQTKLQWLKTSALPISATLDFQGNTALSTAILIHPLEQLKTLAINGQLEAEHISLPPFTIDHAQATLKTQAQTLLLNPLTLHLYQGESTGALNLNMQTGTLFFNQNITHLKAEDFFHALSSQNPFNGNLDLSMHAHLNCTLAHPLDSFSGNGTLLLKDGQIKQFNLATLLDITEKKLRNIMDHLPPPEERMPKTSTINPRILEGDTSFKIIALQYHMEHSHLQADSLLFQNHDLELRGNGNYGLENRRLDSYIQVRLNTEDTEINKLQSLLGGSIPLHIYGSLQYLEIFPSTHRLLTVLQSMWIKRNLAQPMNIIQQQINQAFDLTQ